MSEKKILVDMHLVASSNVHSIGYHDDKLFVRYQGSNAVYISVPAFPKAVSMEVIFQSVMKQSSKGSYLFHAVKNNQNIETKKLEMTGSADFKDYIFQEKKI